MSKVLVERVEELAAEWAGPAAAVSVDHARGSDHTAVTIWDAKGEVLLVKTAPTTVEALTAARDELKKLIP